MKTNTKRFFNLNPHRNDGFTLVELIVVIAILAILAAVAVPAYSGYIEKANKAGDETLLATINKAFASACLENGFSQYDVAAASIPVDPDGKLGTSSFTTASENPGIPKYVASVALNNGTIDAKILSASFASYYAGNENASFKTIRGRSLQFVPALGGFVDPMEYEGDLPLSYGGNVITVSAETMKKLSESAFGDLGSDVITGKVDMLAGISAAVMDNETSSIYKVIYGTDNGASYMAELMTTLNLTQGQMEEIWAGFNGDQTKQNEFLANSLVLTAANQTKNLGDDFLSGSNLADTIKGNLNTDPTTGLAQAALAYGMYTAYANSTGNQEMLDKINSVENTGNFSAMTDILADIENDTPAEGKITFQQYIASAEGQKDMDAYLSAMDTINNTASKSSDAAIQLLNNGFSDPELTTLLQQLMGK